MEVLAGARTAQDEHHVRRLLVRSTWLPCDPVADFEAAARVHRTAHRAGISPGSHVDCMVVAVAARTGTPLLTFDALQARIARLFDLRVLGD